MSLKDLDAMIAETRGMLLVLRGARDEALAKVFKMVDDGAAPDEALSGLADIDANIRWILQTLHSEQKSRELLRVLEIEQAATH